MPFQRSLFDDDATSAEVGGLDPLTARLSQSWDEARQVAAKLPPGVFFGTSSWSFPGWAGLVFSTRRSTTELAREGLREYAKHPLLTTVGVDRSFYAPIPVDDLRAYAEQLPPGFRCCFKAPMAVTGFSLGRGEAAASINPDFLSVDRFVDDLLAPLNVAFAAHTGPIVLEFPPFDRRVRLDPHEFVDRLDAFLTQVPRGLELAVELRDRSLLTPRYAQLLAHHRVAHTYNYWSAMPMPLAQASVVPLADLPFIVIRLLLKPGTWYEEQRERFRPFDRVQARDGAMRNDVIGLITRAVRRNQRVYVLVNNKAEGSAPLTIAEIARALVTS